MGSETQLSLRMGVNHSKCCKAGSVSAKNEYRSTALGKKFLDSNIITKKEQSKENVSFFPMKL